MGNAGCRHLSWSVEAGKAFDAKIVWSECHGSAQWSQECSAYWSQFLVTEQGSRRGRTKGLFCRLFGGRFGRAWQRFGRPIRSAIEHHAVSVVAKPVQRGAAQQLRSQKPRRKRYLCGRDRRGQIPYRRPISERPSHIEDRKQVGHWEGDSVIGAAHMAQISAGLGAGLK